MADGRLFRILYYLVEKGGATAPELAREFEVSQRTIYRDIEALSASGIPVYTEPGRGGGIRLLRGYVLDKAALSEEERLELLTTLQSMAATGRAAGGGTLTKLSALFGLDAGDWLEVDFSRWGDFSGDNARFETLKTAVTRHREVLLTYENTAGQRSQRRVQPLKLAFRSREWYLKAFCLQRQDFRIFKLNRIAALTLTDTVFVPRPCPAGEIGPQPQFPELALRFPPGLGWRAWDEFDPARIERQPDGSLIARARMPVDDWLLGYLLSLGPQVRVLEPAYLRGMLADAAREIYEKNRE